MNSIYIYRLPNSDNISAFSGEAIPGIHPGFVISPFICNSDSFVSIVNPQEILLDENTDEFLYALLSSDKYAFTPHTPDKSTSTEDYFREVESILTELEGDPHKKTIACREIVMKGKLNVRDSFLALCENYPSAYVFLFCTPQSGAWMGASPELLLEANEGGLYTYALAGTRTSGTDTPWDQKNIFEHRIVSDYIMSLFRSFGMEPIASPISTRRAGNVEHLFQSISAPNCIPNFASDIHRLPESGREYCNANFQLFLTSLSPTPALCGMPKAESMERIQRLENFPRRYYGGFFGCYENEENFKFYVNLRSLNFDDSNFCVYAGGGITSQSSPASEWRETTAKARGIIHCLQQ